MKNTLLALFAVIALINPLKAQDIKKEMDAFIKKFEAAYNKKDDAALKMLYTEKAVWTDPDGLQLMAMKQSKGVLLRISPMLMSPSK